MAKNNEIVVKGFLIKEDGETVPLESLTDGEFAEVKKKWSRRMSDAMNRYFAARPVEEYIRFIEALEKEEKRTEEQGTLAAS